MKLISIKHAILSCFMKELGPKLKEGWEVVMCQWNGERGHYVAILSLKDI